MREEKLIGPSSIRNVSINREGVSSGDCPTWSDDVH
jgi:hypothetical protein